MGKLYSMHGCTFESNHEIKPSFFCFLPFQARCHSICNHCIIDIVAMNSSVMLHRLAPNDNDLMMKRNFARNVPKMDDHLHVYQYNFNFDQCFKSILEHVWVLFIALIIIQIEHVGEKSWPCVHFSCTSRTLLFVSLSRAFTLAR
jgi:hypothetical protein